VGQTCCKGAPAAGIASPNDGQLAIRASIDASSPKMTRHTRHADSPPVLGIQRAARGAIAGIVVLFCSPIWAADFGTPKPVQTTRQAMKSVSDLKSQVKKIYGAYHAMEIRYVQETRNGSASGQIIPRMSFTYAYKGEKRLKRQENPKGEGIYDTFAFNDHFQQHYNNDLSRLTIDKRKESFTDIDAYINVLGIPMQDAERATAATHPNLLPACLDSGDWRVLPELQLIDDQECHILESTMGHRLWIDSAVGVMRFRETSQPVRSRDPDKWPIFERFYYSQYTECGNGIRLPKLVKVDSFNSTKAPEQEWSKIARQHIFTVDEIRVNDDVSADLFTLKVPDGTYVMDMINNTMFKMGDPASGLDRIIDVEQKGNARGVGRLWLIGINLAVVVMLVAYFIGRRLFTASK
jgi:outer membrane lipoprotein-sorting protein